MRIGSRNSPYCPSGAVEEERFHILTESQRSARGRGEGRSNDDGRYYLADSSCSDGFGPRDHRELDLFSIFQPAVLAVVGHVPGLVEKRRL
jgi:hypothetical protein